MDVAFRRELADRYKSMQQRVRVWSEDWCARQAYCPGCGAAGLFRHRNNNPAGDFACNACTEQFELKSKGGKFGPKVVDGDYRVMLDRLSTNRAANLFLLSYDRSALTVRDLVVVPRHFLSASLIERQRPLPSTARRAGWIGCNIMVGDIPASGRIHLIRSGVPELVSAVRTVWHQTLFLRKASNDESRGWLLQVMRCIETIGQRDFTLDEVYAFAPVLQKAFPDNHHVRPQIRQQLQRQIRQQLQRLRDQGYLAFLGAGRYRLNVRTDV